MPAASTARWRSCRRSLGIGAGGHDRKRRAGAVRQAADLPVAEWPALIAILRQGSADRPRAGASGWSAARARQRVRTLAALLPVFCTADGAARASIVTKRIRDKPSGPLPALRRRAEARLRAARSPPRRHHPHPHRRAADARQRGDRALSRREGGARAARLRRPDRQDPRPALARERGLGALQARPRHRSSADRRGAGYEPGAVGHHRAAGGRVRGRRRRARRDCGARSSRSATTSSRSISFQGADPRAIPRQADAASSATSRPPRSNGATSAWTIRSARTTAC